MTDDYGWTAGEVSPDAPNQSAVLAIEKNGTRWISQVKWTDCPSRNSRTL
jgi:hypothetical protein